MRGPRTLDVDEITDALLADCGLRRGSVTTQSYRCTDVSAVLVPTRDVVTTSRAMNREDLVRILKGFRDSDDIPPVPIYHEPVSGRIYLLDGMHRWRASLAIGFPLFPAILCTRTEAEECGALRANLAQ